MPEFQFCQVCRINHNQGRGHKYSTKHKQRLDAFLSKALQKIKDVSFFLRFPAQLRETDRSANAFWCSFCEETISEDGSGFVCSNTIKHLGSSKHLGVLKKFWHDNGADVEKRHLYAFQSEQLAKWENACKALLTTCNSTEASAVALNNIHTESFSSKTTPLQGFCVSSFANSNISDPSPSCNDGIFRQDTSLLGYTTNISDYHSNPSILSFVQTHSCQDQTGKLTCIRQQDRTPGLGNVHTGAPPPWLHMINEAKEQSSTSGSGKGRKQRNPKRVGAAWADKRRAEMEATASGKSLQIGPVIGKGWLPNFGRVWQSGSRRETKKEYESEKIERNLDMEPKVYQPYVSKRQRLGASSEPATQNTQI